MYPEIIIAVGLVLDAFGALGVVVPDLPPRYRAKVRRITPIIREYDRAADEIEEINDEMLKNDENLEKVRSLMRRTWPAIQSHYQTQIRRVPDYREGTIGSFESVSVSVTDRGIVLETGVRERPFNLSTEGLRNMIDQYIERRYRLFGWLLLSIGFGVQFIGTMSSLLIN